MRTTALLWAAAYAVGTASSSSISAPPANSSVSALDLSSPSSLMPDSVYASSGFDTLSPLNRVALLATIAVFLLLSILSGRELYVLRYGRSSSSSASASPDPSSSATAAGGALQAKPHGSTNSYTTPKHHSYGGIPTPQSATAGPTTLHHPSSSMGNGGGGDVSTGAEMRERLFVLLFAASTIRVVSLIVEITTLRAMAASSAASLYARLLSMFLWLPALLFVSMYGLVLLFWAQLCYACLGKFHPWPRRLFFAFNVVLYLVFLVLLIATATSGAFWRACDLVLGGVYALGLGAMLYYSVRLIHFFRTQGPDDEFFFDRPSASTSPRQLVLRRITVVCVLLSVLFAVKASYLLGLGVGVVPSEETQFRSPEGVHHLAFEFAIHFCTEFVPCALLLLVTRKQSTRASAATSASTSAGGLLLPTHLTNGGGGGGGVVGGNSYTPSVHYGLRGRNNSAFNDDNQSVGSGSLTGYQFQAVQRSYGAALTNALRATGTTGATTGGAYQPVENPHAVPVSASASQPSYV